MNNQAPSPALDRPTWSANFHTRLTRYRNLLTRRWWIPVVIVVIAVVVETLIIRYMPPKYISLGRMIVSIKLSLPEGSVYNEELSNFLGTQAALMQSGSVINRAQVRLAAQKPNLAAAPVKLSVTVQPRTSIFVLQAIGDSPDYTQSLLQACMDEYAALKKEMRAATSDTTLAGLTEEVKRLEKELRTTDEELVAFAGSNSVVVLQEQGNNAGAYVATLNQRLAAMKFEYELLKALSLDQNLERRGRTADLMPSSEGVTDSGRASSDAEYVKAKQAVLLLNLEEQELNAYLRPQHPKLIALKEEIARRERLLDSYRQQSKDDIDNRKTALSIQIEKLDKEVKEWDAKLLEISRKTAEFQKLKANSTRTQALYDRLIASMRTLDVNKEINAESVTTMERASEAIPDRPKLSKNLPLAALVGLAISVAVLMLIDRLDDRMNSLTELSEWFTEAVLAQIPREKSPGKKADLALLAPDDARHAFLEAFRSIRSSILYMSETGKQPRTMLVTSSEPNDGKSMTAANLAITMAVSGSRVLLVDADLRKGLLHKRFGLNAKPGLSESLAKGYDWTAAVQKTSLPTLFFLPCGEATQKSGELFLSTTAQKFLKDAAASYDYVLIDTAPVMAADDVATLAPHMDGVIFVIRAERTSARVARASLELLTKRRAQILGIVFNAVRTTSGDYYYYYKYKDYYKSYPGA